MLVAWKEEQMKALVGKKKRIDDEMKVGWKIGE
jgi:hypothetical protein